MTSQRAGFSLFEVLIAFAILALVLTALIPGQAHLLVRAKDSDERALAHEYAISRTTALSEAPLSTQGIAIEQYQDWRVTETVETLVHTEDGMITETIIEIQNISGRVIARNSAIGFHSDGP